MTDIQRYLNLVISEHADKPNFMAVLTELLQKIDDIDVCGSISPFDLDTAVGVQLDVLGLFLDISRILAFQPSAGISPVLDDDTYRLALRAKVAKNTWDGTIPGIQAIWTNLFDTYNIHLVLIDNQDMTMGAVIIGMTSTIQTDLVNHGYFVPKPEGVQMNIVVPPNKLFAYGVESDAFGGYDEGYWVQYTIM